MSLFLKIKRALKDSKRVMVMSCALLVGGCATGQKETSEDYYDKPNLTPRYEQLDSLNAWRVRAKAAVRSSNDAQQFNIDWHFNQGEHQIRIYGPLGIGNVLIDWGVAGVTVKNSDGVLYYGNDVDALLYETTGLILPMAALSYWIFALPEPYQRDPFKVFYNRVEEPRGSMPSAESNGGQTIARLMQHGWQLTFDSYRHWVVGDSLTHRLLLPRKIRADGVNESGDELEIKLAVKRWHFEPTLNAK